MSCCWRLLLRIGGVESLAVHGEVDVDGGTGGACDNCGELVLVQLWWSLASRGGAHGFEPVVNGGHLGLNQLLLGGIWVMGCECLCVISLVGVQTGLWVGKLGYLIHGFRVFGSAEMSCLFGLLVIWVDGEVLVWVLGDLLKDVDFHGCCR